MNVRITKNKHLTYEYYFNLESALHVDTDNKRYEQNDFENITWISHLTYLDPNAEIRECTAQGLLNQNFNNINLYH